MSGVWRRISQEDYLPLLVTADASLLRTESAEQSTTLNAGRLDALPLIFGSINGGSMVPRTSSAFYNNYRYQRRPDEQASLSRTFRIREKMTLAIRAEFFNVFNRTEPNNPSQSNISATQVVGVSGFGYINVGSTAANPRNGQLVARFQF